MWPHFPNPSANHHVRDLITETAAFTQQWAPALFAENHIRAEDKLDLSWKEDQLTQQQIVFTTNARIDDVDGVTNAQKKLPTCLWWCIERRQLFRISRAKNHPAQTFLTNRVASRRFLLRLSTTIHSFVFIWEKHVNSSNRRIQCNAVWKQSQKHRWTYITHFIVFYQTLGHSQNNSIAINGIYTYPKHIDIMFAPLLGYLIRPDDFGGWSPTILMVEKGYFNEDYVWQRIFYADMTSLRRVNIGLGGRFCISFWKYDKVVPYF